MRLSIVIVSYNTRDEVLRAIQSIIDTTHDLEHEVIVVDNGSSDGTVVAVRERFPAIRLIDAGQNLWFTGGNNLGIEAAHGKYVMSLNPDTVIQPGALQTMVTYLDAHPGVGAVTSKMIFPDGTLQITCSRLAGFVDLLLDYTLLGPLVGPWREQRRREMWYANWDRETNHSVEVAPDSNLIMRSSLLSAIGLYDERLKLYFTEDDLCRRILDAGYEVHYIADATIIHDEHASVSKVQKLATRIYFDDLITYTRKHFGILGALCLAGLVFPTRAAMYIKQSLTG